MFYTHINCTHVYGPKPPAWEGVLTSSPLSPWGLSLSASRSTRILRSTSCLICGGSGRGLVSQGLTLHAVEAGVHTLSGTGA